MLLAEVLDKSWDILRKAEQQAFERNSDRVRLLVQFAHEQARLEIVQPAQKRRWALHLDFPWLDSK